MDTDTLTRDGIAAGLPASGRRSTLVETLERLWDRTNGTMATIVEVGTIRGANTSRIAGDGWGTRAFAWYAARTHGRVVTIDPDHRAIAASKKVCRGWERTITWIHDNAEHVVGRFGYIDLLYMDGPPDAIVHRAIWDSLECRPGLVLWDDILEFDTWTVKGERTIPHMIADGYRVVFARDRQALLEQPWVR